MSPTPRDFTSIGLSELSRDQMAESIKLGRPGTAMQPFGTLLSPNEINAVIAFIREQFMAKQTKNTRYHLRANGWGDHDRYRAAFPFALGQVSLDRPIAQLSHNQKTGRALFVSVCIGCHERGRVGEVGTQWESRPLSFPRNGQTPSTVLDAVSSASSYGLHERPIKVARDDVQVQRGEALFAANCAFCHGRDGSGRNWIGRFVEPHAADLVSDPKILALSAVELRQRIRDGVEGSAMPAWKQVLPDTDIEAIVVFLKEAQVVVP